MLRAPLLAGLVSALLAGAAAAQSELWRFFPPPASDFTMYGTDLRPAGDVDADGHPDLVVGAPWLGYVEVRSGFDGHVIRKWQQPAQTGSLSNFGSSVDGAADVTGDGRPDILVGGRVTPPFGPWHVEAFDGATGTQVLDIGPGGDVFDSLGESVAWVGDLDGDGLADIAAGAPRATGPGFYFGHGYVYSGGTGALLYQQVGPNDFAQLGWDTLGPGDLTGDGVPDVLFSAPYADLPQTTTTDGLVRVLSGADGSVVKNLVDGPSLGFSLGAAGDLDLDGVPDLVIGTGLEVHTVSGASLTTLDKLPLYNSSVAGGADLTGDGVPDFVVGWVNGIGPTPGQVQVVSGATGHALFTIFGDSASDAFGTAVCLPGDVNGDGRQDFAATALEGYLQTPNLQGRVRVFDADRAGFRTLGGAAAGAAGRPTLSASGVTAPDAAVALDVAGAPPFAPAFLVSSVKLACQPMPGGVLVPNADFVLSGVTDGLGRWSLSGRWPDDGSGQPHWFQVWIADASLAGGWAATGGLAATTK